jgi:K+-sensing histidine kinase KdpD
MTPLESSQNIPESGTWFAPPGRAPQQQLHDMAEYCLHNPVTRAIVDSVDGYVLILNKERQVLAANPETLKALNVTDAECLIGLRPGELFGCAFSNVTPAGCGTSKNCSTCGAVISILASQKENEPSVNECLMSVIHDGKSQSHEFTVRSTPIILDDTPLTIFVVHDISAIKRRDALENVFIHDLNNLLTGLQGWSEILVRHPQDAASIAQKIVSLSTHLTQEVQNQRLLLQAERGELKVTFEPVKVETILDGMKSFFSGYPVESVNRLDIELTLGETVLTSSPPLLTRVLANMVKNAMEATRPPARVRIWFEFRDNQPCFVIHNPGEIPPEIAQQIFKRSFSTKGSHGRGLGTYSMKLFGEQYLGGQVDFSTDSAEGTSFFILLPVENTFSETIM